MNQKFLGLSFNAFRIAPPFSFPNDFDKLLQRNSRSEIKGRFRKAFFCALQILTMSEGATIRQSLHQQDISSPNDNKAK
jgi:hypothetical protein